MQYLDQLQRQKVFSLDFVTRLTGNENTAKGLLQRYVQKGYIARIRRNLYTALDLANKVSLASRYEIACGLDENAFISHHSALEFHGVANQVFNEITVSVGKRITDFEFEGSFYHAHISDMTIGVIVPPGNPLVRVTNIERTVIDCLNDIDLSGGLDEIVECLKLLPALDESRLLECLNAKNIIYLWQKTGFVLQSFADTFMLSEDFFKECRSHIRDRKQVLGDGTNKVYYPEWKLYAPGNPVHLNREEGEPLV